MNLTQHPEHEKYLKDHDVTNAIKTALASWLKEHEEEGKALKTAVFQLTTLFQEYNQMMWQEFPFCQMCLGGCCVVGASEVSAMDAAALSVLDHELPVLPAQTHHSERACIYLGEQGCTWPSNWRPLKCMIFFSLGSGDWQLESSDDRYGRLTQGLQAVLDEHLPLILDSDSSIEAGELAEPIEYAASLSHRLAAQFLPLAIRENTGRSPSPLVDPTTATLLAMAVLTEQIFSEPLLVMADQLLADLEQYEWVVTGHPAQEKEILEVINGRYLPHIHEHPIYMQFTKNVQQYQQSLQNNLEET